MKIRPFSRISVEQFSNNNKPDFELLMRFLNPFLEQFNLLFDKNIDKDNLKQEIVQTLVEVNTSGVPKSELVIKKGSVSKVSGCVISRVEKTNPNDPYLTASPFVEFIEGPEVIEIKRFYGFPPDKKYIVTFLIF